MRRSKRVRRRTRERRIGAPGGPAVGRGRSISGGRNVGRKRIVIVGAGPCGLACARELTRLGHEEWVVLEQGASAGGHASSVVDPQGFTWDIGGHVVFSHYGEFDALLDEAMGDEVAHSAA
jgi:NADPH-dependent 2,4-dienoyl-CoA reductase/sulfur reductase-like enzyme